MKRYRLLFIILTVGAFTFEIEAMFRRKNKKTTQKESTQKVEQKKDYDTDAFSRSQFNRLSNLEKTKTETIESGRFSRPKDIKNTDNYELSMKEALRQSAINSINNYRNQLENQGIPEDAVNEIVEKLQDQLTQKHQADRVKDLKRAINTGDAHAQNETTRTEVGKGTRVNKGGLHDRVYGNTRKAYNDYYNPELSSGGNAQQYKKAITNAYKQEIDVSLQDAVQFVKEGKITREQFMDVMTSLKKTMLIDFQERDSRTGQYIDQRNTKVISLAKDGLFDSIELKKYIDKLETEALKEAQKAAKERDSAGSSSVSNKLATAVEYSKEQGEADEENADAAALADTRDSSVSGQGNAKPGENGSSRTGGGVTTSGQKPVNTRIYSDGKGGEPVELLENEGDDPFENSGNDSPIEGDKPI
jgi:hypothetical protein